MDPELRDLMLGGHNVDASAPGGAFPTAHIGKLLGRTRADNTP